MTSIGLQSQNCLIFDSFIEFGNPNDGIDAGCERVSYCFQAFSEEGVDDVLFTFTPSPANSLIEEDVAGFFFDGTSWIWGVDIEAEVLYEICLDFHVNANYNSLDNGPLDATLTTNSTSCGEETIDYNIITPSGIQAFIPPNTTAFLSQLATNTVPNGSGLATPAMSQVFDNTMVIAGTLIVDLPEYFFSLSSNIYLRENAKIIIRDGSHLIIQHEASVLGCFDMWQSIFVNEGGKLTIKDLVTISDGLEAILALDGSELDITNATFLNNHVGISTTVNSNGTNNIETTINNNTFTSDALLPPYEGALGFAGMEFNELENSFMLGNQFDNLNNGILANQSNIIAFGGGYHNMIRQSGVPISGFGIRAIGNGHLLLQEGNGEEMDAPTFSNCFMGIYAQRCMSFVQHNTMENVQTGVRLTLSQNLQTLVRHNTILAGEAGISTFLNLPVFPSSLLADNDIIIKGDPETAVGIRMHEIPGFGGAWQVEDNRIEVVEGRVGIRARAGDNISLARNHIQLNNADVREGISLENAPSVTAFCNLVEGQEMNEELATTGIFAFNIPDATLSCNSFDQTRVGLQIVDFNLGVDMRGNSFNKNHWGFQMGFEAPAQLNQVAVIPPQNHRGNLWDNNSQDIGAIHFGNFISVDQSKFWANSNVNSNYMPMWETPNASVTWFNSQLSNNTFICPSETICPDLSQQEWIPDELDENVNNESIDSEAFDGAVLWRARKRLLKNLANNAEYTEDFSAILNNDAAESITSFLDYENEIKTAYEFSETDVIQVETELNDLQIKQSELADLYGDLQISGENPSENTDFQSLLAEAITSHQNFQITYQNQDTDFEGAITALANIEANQEYEKMEVLVNEVLLEAMINENGLVLTNQQEQTLKAIAFQCPFYGGDAVFKARALLDLTDPIDDVALCEGQGSNFIEKNSMTNFSIYPNPTSDIMMVKFNQQIEEGKLIITGLLGKQILEKTIRDVSEIPLIVTALKTGFYHISLYDEAQLISTQKISIIK